MRALSRRSARSLSVVLCALILIVGCALALPLVGMRLHFEWIHGYSWDSPLYLTVGRGISQGFLPYRDFYENKPPGIFLVSALFFLFFEDLSWTAAVQIFVLLMTFFVIAGFAIWQAKDKKMPAELRLLLIAEGILFGSIAMIYTSIRSGLFQVESFGAAFGTAFAALAATMPKRPRWTTGLAAAALLFSIGFKEPFVLSCAGAALLTLRTPADVRGKLAIPLLFAAVTGVFAMLILGYLDPYVRIYLPVMFGHFGWEAGPLWVRGLNVKRIVNELLEFSPALLSVLVLLTMMSGMHVMADIRKMPLRIVAWMAVLAASFYGASTAVASGVSYYGHHFVFALPVYAALFFVSTLALAKNARKRWALPLAVIASLLLIVTLWGAPRESGGNLDDLKTEATNAALEIDRVLDRCEKDRYLFLGPNGIKPFGLTRHLPLGPLFFQYDYLLAEQRTFFREEFAKALETTPLIVLDPDIEVNTLRERTQQELDASFTREPWPCAGDVRPPSRYVFYYRKPSL